MYEPIRIFFKKMTQLFIAHSKSVRKICKKGAEQIEDRLRIGVFSSQINRLSV